MTATPIWPAPNWWPATSYTYDDEGNRTRRTEIATGDYVDYTWDHRNRLVALEYRDDQGTLQKKVEYDYDVWNRRIAKRVDSDGNSTFDEAFAYVYDDSGKRDPSTGVPLDDIVLVFDDTGSLISRYLHGPGIDQVLAMEASDGSVYWALADNLGSVRDIVAYDSGTGQTSVVNHIEYDAFGNITSETAASGMDYALERYLYSYTGREWDADAEMYAYRARWYDPIVGRFVGEDPIGFAAGDSNISRYVGNGVTYGTDPSGLEIKFGWANGTYGVHYNDKYIGWITNLDADVWMVQRSGMLVPYSEIEAAGEQSNWGEWFERKSQELSEAREKARQDNIGDNLTRWRNREGCIEPSMRQEYLGRMPYQRAIIVPLAAAGTYIEYTAPSNAFELYMALLPAPLYADDVIKVIAKAGGVVVKVIRKGGDKVYNLTTEQVIKYLQKKGIGFSGRTKSELVQLLQKNLDEAVGCAREGLLNAPAKFRGMSNNALNKSISGEQHVLLRKLFKGEAGTGLTRDSLEAAHELSRRAILNGATSPAQKLVHQTRLQQIADALGKL